MSDQFIKAVSFAADKHKNQRRKDVEASPYINHPIALANVLANEGGIANKDVLCAAMLHDTIEDTETTEEELKQLFGNKITSIVLEVTDDKSLPKAVRKQNQVDHAPHISIEAKMVKLADKICNLRDILSSHRLTGRLKENKLTSNGLQMWLLGYVAPISILREFSMG